MWSKHLHLLQPFTALASTRVQFKWIDAKQKALDKIKQIVARNTLLIYPDFNERFDIHTDASGFQLVALIIQYGKPIDFYSRKLMGPQSQYAVTEKELLSIVETLKGFRTILLD